jgi:hypothetical protein
VQSWQCVLVVGKLYKGPRMEVRIAAVWMEGMSHAHFNLSASRFHEPSEIHPQELPCRPISIKLTRRDDRPIQSTWV